MMRVNVEVALCRHRQIEQSMPGDVRQHVIKKSNPGGHVRFSGPVEV